MVELASHDGRLRSGLQECVLVFVLLLACVSVLFAMGLPPDGFLVEGLAQIDPLFDRATSRLLILIFMQFAWLSRVQDLREARFAVVELGHARVKADLV